MSFGKRMIVSTACAAFFVMLASASAQEANPVAREPAQPEPTRVIVKFRETTSARSESQTASIDEAELRAETTRRVAARARVGLSLRRELPAGMQVLEVESQPGEAFAERLARLRADPEIEFAEPDARRYPLAVPNDGLYPHQWYWQNDADTPSAVDAQDAWDITTGSSGVVIAVLDTGVLFDHPDLGGTAQGGRLLSGYDFITDPDIANDGNGRDPDPSDPGDWVTQADLDSGSFPGCDIRPSSWHGTRVSGVVGARTNNGLGIAAGTWSPWILPVRVLGKCGGFDSDIIAAMGWAAGLPTAGVPGNSHPARILNLSLGSEAPTCPQSYRNVIDALAERKVLVVASAGNSGHVVGTPGNCPGVMAVTGLRHAGTKVGFSSLGPAVTLGAPGGNCVNTSFGEPCLFSLDTTYNTGTTTPGNYAYTDQFNANYGTSFAAPIVSAIAGLMLSVNGNLTPAQLIDRAQEGAKKPFPQPSGVQQCHVPNANNPLDLQVEECACTTSTCGAGMANAPGAVAAAQRPIAAIAVLSNVSPGQPVTLSAAGSAAACGRTIAQHAWAVVNGLAAVSPTNTETTTVVAPPLGQITVRLTVTDDVGRQDSADIAVTPTSTVTAAPAAAGTAACLPEVSPVGVLVTPQTATLPVNGSVTFSASVVDAADGSVTWQVNGVTGGNDTVGTITSDGVYAAPAAVPTPAFVTVTAVANADDRATASARVTITAPAPQSPPSQPGPGAVTSDGGGGAGLGLLALLAAAVCDARRRSADDTFRRWRPVSR